MSDCRAPLLSRWPSDGNPMLSHSTTMSIDQELVSKHLAEENLPRKEDQWPRTIFP
jgi:hypothetical protein